MQLKGSGKIIAILFYARARAVLSRAFVIALFFLAGSTGLIATAEAAGKQPPRQPEVQNKVQLPTIDLEKIKPIQSLRIIRTNVKNNAFEELILQAKQISLRRNTGFKKNLALEEGVFEALEQKIRALKTYEITSSTSRDGLRIEAVIKTEDGEERFELDPLGRLRPLFVEVMDYRHRMLRDGK